MKNIAILGKQNHTFGEPTRYTVGDSKQVTLKTLVQLKAKLYEAASRSIKQNPAKAETIQKRVDADAAHLRFAINMVQVKM